MIERHFHNIFYNGKSLADFGVHCTGKDTFNGPEKDYETIEIPGRNGDLHIFNERFKNVEVTYHAFIAGDNFTSFSKQKDFRSNVSALRAHLYSSNGYCRLEDTYHPDEYRKGLYKGPFSTESILLMAGEFDLVFDCMPQRFLKDGTFSTSYTSNFNLINPYLFSALPFMRVYGYGDVNVNDATITISNQYPYSYIDIDCDIQDAYRDNINCNKYINIVNGEFFKLTPGNNRITFSSTVKRIDITPNWWTI